ncbi:MAG TPA: hypothetical protein VKM54_17220 [Myxococcota bacterium]|nr:hypothetical protein [Myxococcota bacterium]
MRFGAAPAEGELPPLEDLESVRAAIRERLAKFAARATRVAEFLAPPVQVSA